MLTGQRGQIGLKHVLVLALVGSIIYAGVRVVPVVYAVYSFEDKVKTEALLAGSQFKTDDQIRYSIRLAAYENRIELAPDAISILRLEDRMQIQLEVQYVMPISLFGRTWVWKRHVLEGSGAY
jgi:hypothetical protein